MRGTTAIRGDRARVSSNASQAREALQNDQHTHTSRIQLPVVGNVPNSVAAIGGVAAVVVIIAIAASAQGEERGFEIRDIR